MESRIPVTGICNAPRIAELRIWKGEEEVW